ncbi:MAG: UTP--glucose-1-phosphate uridylyltransferase GalU [Alphaproteobacteria bacterium]
MIKPVRKAVFPVGGYGTRFLPATKAMPKEMLPVVDKPLIQYAVEEAKAAGITHFIFVTSRGKSALEDHFDVNFDLERLLEANKKTAELDIVRAISPKEGQMSYTRQPAPLGLGHAVWCAREIVGNEPFAVLLPDDLVMADTPCMKQLVDAYSVKGGNVVAVQDVPRAETRKYGVLDIAKDEGKLVSVKGLVEKPAPEDAPSTLTIIGRYILQPELFAQLDKQERGAGGEIQLTDAMAKLIGTQPFHGYRFDGTRYDCGDKVGFLTANLAFALRRPELAPRVREAAAALLKS